MHPAQTWVDLAASTGTIGQLTVEDLVVVADAIVSAWPHVQRARLRLVRAGLPEPELNQDVVDGDGVWLARVDMVWRRQRVIVEYEGDQHRTDRAQWQRDIERVRRLEAAGWRVVRMSAEDLRDPGRWARLVGLLAGLLAG